MNTPPFNALPLSDLTLEFTRAGVSSHQAKVTFKAMHRLGVLDGAQMPEVSAAGKKFLASQPELPRVLIEDSKRALDGTIKLRVKTPHGEAVESVAIPARGRLTLCVSSQAGCAAACAFCHTGTMGLLRNLETWEIVEQVRAAQSFLDAIPENEWLGEGVPRRISNIVFMGMGEPLHNEDNVVRACRILNDDTGLGLSRRRLVMSTAGVGNRIRPFWERGVASLALSLHATTDETRSRIVPLNRTWNLAELKSILQSIPWAARESVTIAYLLLDGINDTHADAERLAAWVDGLPAKVNLLEFNPFPGSEFKRSSPERLAEFRQWLYELGVFNTLRHSRGDDVMAACGQLATEGRAKKKRPSDVKSM